MSPKQPAEAAPLPATSSVFPCLEDTEVRGVAQPISARQHFEKTWFLSRGGFDAIDKLLIAVPGFTFVSSRQGTDVQTPFIRVSTESVIAANSINVAIDTSKRRIDLRARRRLFGEYVLVEVLLPPTHRLQSIACEGSAFAVVEDNVLSTDQPELTLRGAGGLFLSMVSELHAQRFQISVTGTGSIQVITPGIMLADQLEANMTAPGSVRIFTNVVQAGSIKLASLGSGLIQLTTGETRNVMSIDGSTCGSGRLRMVAETLTASQLQLSVTGSGGAVVTTKQALSIGTLRGSVTGTGDLRFGCTHSSCTKADYSILGSGFIDAQDVISLQAKVHIAGSGCAKFRGQDEVSARVLGSGEAVLVGNAPVKMRGSVRVAAAEPSHAEILSLGQREAMIVPSRADAFEYCIQTTDRGWTTLSTMLGVLQDIWDDWTTPSVPPMAVPTVQATATTATAVPPVASLAPATPTTAFPAVPMATAVPLAEVEATETAAPAKTAA